MAENERKAKLEKLRRESAARRASNVAREQQLQFEKIVEQARREYNLRVGRGIDQGFKRVKIRNERAVTRRTQAERASIHDVLENNPSIYEAYKEAAKRAKQW